jgi:transketolase
MAATTPNPAIMTVPKPRDQHLRDIADCIRFLSMDAVQNAKSGHPGAPMGIADIATVLFKDFMQFDAADPQWFDRDRFVLSNGHASKCCSTACSI